jgi:hypothetical protein
MPFKSEDIAYFAGLFEGEGTVVIYKWYYKDGKRFPRTTPQMMIRIAMTDIEPLERIVKTIGGYLNGPYMNTKSTKPFICLSIDNHELLQELIPLVTPFLSPRRSKQLNVSI